MFHGIQFPYFNSQQLNLDWIVDKIKGMLNFLPDDGTAGQILRRTADGAEWSDEQQISGGAVDSVNGKTGDVVLDAGDILMDDSSSVEDAVDDLKSAISENAAYGSSRNLFADMGWEDNTAYLYNSGNKITNNNYSATGLIVVGAKTPIYLFGVANQHTCFYDKDRVYISGTLNPYIQTPDNCVYMRVSIEKTAKSTALGIRYDREDYIKVGSGGGDQISRLNYAHQIQSYCGLPMLLYQGEYNAYSLFGGNGWSPYGDVYGVGSPKIYANLDSFNVNFSVLNLTGNRPITIRGLVIESTNCRYCIHDEMGSYHAGNGNYCHQIENCIITQKTADQADFDPRAIGIGLGDNGQIIIDGCVVSSNISSDIDAHTGYAGQTKNASVTVKNCYLEHTVSATYAGVGSDYVDTIFVCGNSVSAEPFEVGSSDTVNLLSFNNEIRS